MSEGRVERSVCRAVQRRDIVRNWCKGARSFTAGSERSWVLGTRVALSTCNVHVLLCVLVRYTCPTQFCPERSAAVSQLTTLQLTTLQITTLQLTTLQLTTLQLTTRQLTTLQLTTLQLTTLQLTTLQPAHNIPNCRHCVDEIFALL